MKILVIDDNEFMRSVVEEILKRSGHTVLTAESAEEGLQKFSERGSDLVITNYQMSRRSGFFVIQELRKLPNPPEIWFSSGALTGELAEQALSMGATRAVSSCGLIEVAKTL